VLAFRGVSQNSLRKQLRALIRETLRSSAQPEGLGYQRAVASLGPGISNSQIPCPCWCWCWCWCWCSQAHLHSLLRLRSRSNQRRYQSQPQQARSACCGPLAERSDGPQVSKSLLYAPRSAAFRGSGLALVWAKRVRARPRETWAPQVARSEAEGRRQQGRLSFAYVSLAKQRNVGRLPGRDPASELKKISERA